MRLPSRAVLLFPAVLTLACARVSAQGSAMAPAPWHVSSRFVLGGDGGWDYLNYDTTMNRLFIDRSDRVMVVDPANGAVLGTIGGLNRGHGVALAYGAGKGFATSGEDSAVTVFDLKSLAILGKTTAADDDDAILYDAVTNRVFTMNGDAGTASVIDPATNARIGTVTLGGKPEFAVSAGDGKVYANIEDKSEMVEIDARTMTVTKRWSIAPCEEPSGLAIDRAHHRVFSVCRNKVMAVSDVVAGKVVASLPIGAGVDGAAFDAGTGDAFASNGEGTLTVVHEDTPDTYHVAATVPTMMGARTITVDPRSHRVYVVGAEFGPQPAAATADNPRRRPPMIPGTFTLLVIER